MFPPVLPFLRFVHWALWSQTPNFSGNSLNLYRKKELIWLSTPALFEIWTFCLRCVCMRNTNCLYHIKSHHETPARNDQYNTKMRNTERKLIRRKLEGISELNLSSSKGEKKVYFWVLIFHSKHCTAKLWFGMTGPPPGQGWTMSHFGGNSAAQTANHMRNQRHLPYLLLHLVGNL